MKIFLVSDIHMQLNHLDQLIDKTGKKVDLILCAGDLTNWGNEEDAKKVTDKICFKSLLTIPGNLDTPQVEKYLEKENFSIHGRKKAVNGWTFVGFGGGCVGYVGDIVYTEKEVTAALEPLLKETPTGTTILVTHQPPFGTKLDRVGGVEHKGSKTVYQLIEKYQPRFQICGHIHESWGEDQIGKTHCYNIAAVKEGRAALLDTNTGAFTRLVL